MLKIFCNNLTALILLKTAMIKNIKFAIKSLVTVTVSNGNGNGNGQ
jgi:hypothetical protein